MAFTNCTAFLTNASSVTIPYTGSGDISDVQYFISNIFKNGNGVWDGNGNFYPATAILSVKVQ